MNVAILDSEIAIDESVIVESSAEIREQVREYERGDRRTFELEIRFPDGMHGNVLTAMTEIPYGETRSYGALAAALDTAPVAVGQACAQNPVPVIVPCHRVVGSDDSLVGYSAADGVVTKRRLLDLESRETDPVQTRLPTKRT